MNRIKFTIVIDTEDDLTEEQIIETMINMKHRLEGYSTPYPRFLSGSDICIDKDYTVDTLPSSNG